ncbi:MAG: CDP-alcohol phosphatidyltransferase family protein [Spirochaetia bacterium]|nr:CDP-alcohol phosphatidyltransferase family protein [Spirochaetia bacterium]
MKKHLGWVPNLFTLGNLSLGFFSILIASSSHGESVGLAVAGGLIMLAVLLDGADGYAARLLDAKSELGAQLDSLADLATFGLAPGVLMYTLTLHDFNVQLQGMPLIPSGMFIAAVFPACAAYRLARFNVSHDDGGFTGLPSPVAGLIVALMPIAFTESFTVPSAILIFIFVLSAFLMVSTVRYSKPQVSFVRRFSPARMAIVILALLSALCFVGIRYGASFGAAGLFSLIVIYVVSGIVSFMIHKIQEYRM